MTKPEKTGQTVCCYESAAANLSTTPDWSKYVWTHIPLPLPIVILQKPVFFPSHRVNIPAKPSGTSQIEVVQSHENSAKLTLIDLAFQPPLEPSLLKRSKRTMEYIKIISIFYEACIFKWNKSYQHNFLNNCKHTFLRKKLPLQVENDRRFTV